jgi:tetratricopeptide (TPR) repeat protein
MMQPPLSFSLATQLHKAGKLLEAKQQYQNALAANPDHSTSWHMLGLVDHQLGDTKHGIDLITKALTLNPREPRAYFNRALLQESLNNTAAALADYERASSLEPAFFTALFNRAALLDKIGQIDAAEHIYSVLLHKNPKDAEAFVNRGTIRQTKGLLAEAASDYRAALRVNQNHVGAWSNLGTVFKEQGNLTAAAEALQRALQINPSFTDALNNYGLVLRRLGRLQDSADAYEKSIQSNPHATEGYQGRGETLAQMGELASAMVDFESALRLNPTFADALWAKGATLMSIEPCSAGWQLLENRFDYSGRKMPRLQSIRPRWSVDGGGRVGERLLVWSEQGVGDEVFFASWLGQLGRLSNSVTIAVDARLLPVYRRSFPALTFIDKAAIPPDREYDCHLPIGSIPKSLLDLGLTPEPLRQCPFLQSDPERVALLRQQLQRPTERLCGLTWRSTRPEIGAEKSIDLEALLPILRTPGLRFVSLQYGEHRAEIEQLREQHGIEILQHPEIDNFRDLDGHAALIRACDLVVSVCNATAHLAGAQGVPGYILAPRGKSLIWYWANRQNGHSLWYPTLELFEQAPTLSWDQPIQEVAARLSLPPP